VKGVSMMVNPGIEHMRLRAPVRAGDRVRMHATLKDLRDLPGGGIRATITLQFEVEGQSRPAAFGDAVIVYYTEPPRP
jgi:acyl dehydratase